MDVLEVIVDLLELVADSIEVVVDFKVDLVSVY